MENGYLSNMTKAQRTRGEGGERRPQSTLIKRTRGRPEEFDEQYIDEAVKLIKMGLVDSEICEKLGIHITTYWRWRQAYPELSKAVKAAKDIVDDRVEEAMMKTAREGNTTAQIFWLKNRRPADWRDRKETELILPMGEASEAGEIDVRTQALAALALFTEATYDEGPMIEATDREEIDNGQEPASAQGLRQASEGDDWTEEAEDDEVDLEADIDLED